MRRFVSFALLLAACRPEPTVPAPASAPDHDAAPPEIELQRPKGVHVELLLAGKPPQTALLRPLEERRDSRSMFLGWRHYGAPGDAKRDITGKLEVHAAQPREGASRVSVVLKEGSVDSATVVTTLGPWGPIDTIDQTQGEPGLGSEALTAVVDSLLLAWPQRPVGEGAIWTIERDSTGDSIERTTVELMHRYSDGMQLVVKSEQVQHVRPSPDAKAELKAAPARTSGNSTSSTATLWLHDDQLLPVRAFGQYRRTRDNPGGVTTDFVDWSLDP